METKNIIETLTNLGMTMEKYLSGENLTQEQLELIKNSDSDLKLLAIELYNMAKLKKYSSERLNIFCKNREKLSSNNLIKR